jgi:hypothetical protein
VSVLSYNGSDPGAEWIRFEKVFPKGVAFLDVPFNVFFKPGDVFRKELVVAKGDRLHLSSYESVSEGWLYIRVD